MLPKPRADLKPNTADFERLPLVKPTGFREYDARWRYPEEINLMGLNAVGLGMATLFAAALEPRIRAALVSSYLNTFRECVMSVSHCVDNYIPGILNWAEMYDVAGLIAPRPLFVESGDKDDIFPIAASRESFLRLKKVYEVFGAGANTGQEVFEGPHRFSGKLGLPFLAGHLG